MDTLYRHWLILRMIPRRGRIATTTIKDRLASEYGIETTLRTIQRDLVTLEASQFPLECDSNRPAGWSWRKDAPAFDIPNMDLVTALTFRLTELHMTRLMPHGALSVLQPYFQAAGERLERAPESTLASWPDKVRIVSRNLNHIPPVVPEEVAEAVYKALLEERRFKAVYSTSGGKKKEYEVNPLGMAFVEGLTYLIASLNDHVDPILLLLHRFLKVDELPKAATVPKEFNLDDYISRELSFPVGERIQLKALFSHKGDILRLEEAPIAQDQMIREFQDGRFELVATLADSLQLRWWLRGFGERVEVLAPDSLRQEFVNLTKELSGFYLK